MRWLSGRSVAAATAGLVGYGLWAAYANAAHGGETALRAGLVQGSYSFLLTLVMSVATEWIYRWFAGLPLRAMWTIAAVAAALFMTAFAVNAAAGTPEIIATIAPGFAIGTFYTSVYVMALARGQAKQRVTSP